MWAPPDNLTEENVKKLSGLGLSYKQMAWYFGAEPQQWLDFISDNPRVKRWILKGRSQAIAHVTNSAFNMATSGKFPQMTAFWLKCKAGWSETPNDVEELSAPEPEIPPITKALAEKLLEQREALKKEKDV